MCFHTLPGKPGPELDSKWTDNGDPDSPGNPPFKPLNTRDHLFEDFKYDDYK